MDTQRDIERERYIDEHEGMCGTCHYWQPDGDQHCCMCMESIFAAEFTDDDDRCSYHVLRRGL